MPEAQKHQRRKAEFHFYYFSEKSGSFAQKLVIGSQLVTLIFANGGPLGGPRLSFANGVWIDQSLSLKPNFKEIADNVYKAASNLVDFQTKRIGDYLSALYGAISPSVRTLRIVRSHRSTLCGGLENSPHRAKSVESLCGELERSALSALFARCGVHSPHFAESWKELFSLFARTLRAECQHSARNVRSVLAW
ncbi:serpin-ZX-like [Olea europaea subsp. europaea]|uniref:Serpin-ZX-like n=1 Tax=Olea europaea subsp. europaea TaxID=158383 RepID=A0A8S0UXL9_OLEEU|nr:serpin-ZX-like [Olea europaea subsp. europaea]